jgi:VanZ family protein
MFSRTQIVLACLLYTGIVVYGSLVPFHYTPCDGHELLERFTAVLSTPVKISSRSDFLANILLFVPLSLLAMSAMAPPRSKSGWLLIVPVVAICTCIGMLVEFFQLLFPPRNASINDIVAQAIGSILGALAWLCCGKYVVEKLTISFQWSKTHNPLLPLVALYYLVVVVLEAVPFDFTLSPVEVVHKWREGRIHLIPLAALLDPNNTLPIKSIWNIVMLLPLGLMLGGMRFNRMKHVFLLSLVVAGSIELMQLPLLSRNFEMTDILTGTLAIFMGYNLALLRHVTVFPQVVLLTLWVTSVIVINWSPFDFTWGNIDERFRSLSLIPFADYQQKYYIAAFDDLIHKCVLYGLLGVIVHHFLCQRGILIALLGGCVSAVVELGQILLPGRYPSISDVVLGAGACWAGHRIASGFRVQKHHAQVHMEQIRV